MVAQGAQGLAGPPSTTPPGAAAQGTGAPTDALLSVADTVVEQALRLRLEHPDPNVLTAFALGWQVSEVHRPDRLPPDSTADDALPGIDALTRDERARLGLDQVHAGVTKLADPVRRAGLELPDAQSFDDRLNEITDPAERSRAVRTFHVDLFSTLMAADFRVGKAYGLGVALADITRDPAGYHDALRRDRIAPLTDWIRELATAFPAHAARPVADSMEAWSRSVNGPGADNEDAPLQVGAQGHLWRSLLSGEKRAIDMLEASDYLRAAERSLQRSMLLSWRFVRHYWWLAALVVGLFVGGIVIIATASGAAAIVAGVAPVLASLGLTLKGFGASTGSRTSRLEQPVWQAELDTVVFERITPQKILDAGGMVPLGPDEPSLILPDRH